MKKVVLLSHYYHPCTLTPAQRITYWAENLHRLGYYPVVVTRLWNSEIRTHHDTKRALGREVKIEKFPTHEVHYLPFRPGLLDWAYLNFGENWLRPFFLIIRILDVVLVRFTIRFTSFANYLPYLRRLFKAQKINDLIISGEPFYLFKLGFSLNHELGVSWIADYRDDWSTNELQMEKSGSGIRKWVAKVESTYEKKWVGSADSIISVSDRYTQRIADFVGRPGITIQNGFEETLLDLPSVELYDQFTVIYSGVLYPSQDLRLILQILDRCNEIGRPFKLIFLGAGFDVKEKKRIEEMVSDSLKKWVEVTDRFPRATAIEMLQRAHVLLGMAYGNMKGIPSSKLYEYLAIGKPVLLCPTDGDVMEQILSESGLGFFVKNQSQGLSIMLELQDLYENEANLSQLKKQSREVVSKYSRFHQLQKLADSLGK